MNKNYTSKNPSGSETMSQALPGAKNYFQWISWIINPYLGLKMLDIGSGYGIHLEYILPNHPNVTSIDLSYDMVSALQKKFYAYNNFDALQGDFENESNIKCLKTECFDTIVCLNVLEHMRDDVSALKRMKEILSQQKGIAVLMVPAHQWLYGSMDKQAGHFRRYSSISLGKKLQNSGFEILKLYHFNVFGVFPWFINNRILKKGLNGSGVGLQIKIFDAFIVPLMKRVESKIKFPIGQSIITIARAKHD